MRPWESLKSEVECLIILGEWDYLPGICSQPYRVTSAGLGYLKVLPS